jgi:hypothetical protein
MGSAPDMRSSDSSRHGRRGATRLSMAAAIMALVALGGGIAQAQDWRYCLAPLRAEHRVYMSSTFATAKPMERLQDEFASALARAGLRHGAVQCPRGGDERSIEVMRIQAARFNRESGNDVVEFDRWDP